MFNTNKQDELKDKAAYLAHTAKSNIEETASDMRRGAEEIGRDLQKTVTEGKHEALGVINSLKGLLAQYTNSTNVQELKEQILDKACELKGTVSNEVSHAYHTGKDRTVQTVQEKPLLSLGLAVGAGVLLGYILGSKNSSK